jgi:hypothetical protein
MQLFIDNDLSLYITHFITIFSQLHAHHTLSCSYIFTIAFLLLHKTCYCFCFEFQLCISLSNMTLSKIFTPMTQDSNLDLLDIIMIPVIFSSSFSRRETMSLPIVYFCKEIPHGWNISPFQPMLSSSSFWREPRISILTFKNLFGVALGGGLST